MPIWFKSSGVWGSAEAGRIHIKDAGIWKEVQAAWIKTGGVWEKFFEKFALTNDNFASSFTGVATAPFVTFNDDGTVDGNDGSSGNWGSPTVTSIGANYHIKFHKNSGTGTTNGAAEDVWLALDTLPFKGIDAAGAGQLRSAVVGYEISANGGSSVAASGTITLISDRT